MRTTTLVLIVTGVVLLAVALWLATVMPIRSKVTEMKWDRLETTQTKHLNLWGTPLRQSDVILNHLNDGTIHVLHEEGKVLGAWASRHGPWTHSEQQKDGTWITHTRWFIDGKLVAEEEWSTYLRGR